MDLIIELKNLLRGNSNIIMKEDLRSIIDRYTYDFNRSGNLIEKGFWDIKIDRPLADSNDKGLIPKLWDDYLFRRMFTNKEWEELEAIKKESFMKRMRELAKEIGKDKAEREFRAHI